MNKRIILVFLVLSCLFLTPSSCLLAEDNVENNQLENEVNKQLENFDFSNLESIVDNDLANITDEESFKEIVMRLINGEQITDATTILDKIVDLLFGQIKQIIPIVMIIIAIAILGNIVNSFQASSGGKSVSDLTHFVCIAVVLVLIIAVVKNVYVNASNCINDISNQMAIIFPVLLTMLTAMGSVVSVGIYQPVVAFLSSGVVAIFKNIIYPIFLLSLVFVILNNLSSQIKLNKFILFMGSCFKWIIGFVFTLFAGVLAIQGISAGRYDTISLKATRFAMKSYIPILGGYLSDGLDYVMLSGLLIKNAIGVAGLLIMLGTILVPVINILILKLALQFAAGIIEPMGNVKMASLCEDLSKILVYPIVVILAMAFMYFLFVGLLMCTISGV